MNEYLLTKSALGDVGDNTSCDEKVKKINKEIAYLEKVIQKYNGKYFPKLFLMLTISGLVLPSILMFVMTGLNTSIFTQHINSVFGNINYATFFTISIETVFIPAGAIMELFRLYYHIKGLIRKRKINKKIGLLREELTIEQEKLKQLEKEKSMTPKQRNEKKDETTTMACDYLDMDNSYDNKKAGPKLVKKLKR